MFEAGNLGFIGRDDSGICRFDDAVEGLGDLFVAIRDLAEGGAADVFGLGAALVPRVAEHGRGQGDQVARGLQGFDDRSDFLLQPVAGNGFAIARAGFGLAEVVWVMAAGEGGAQRHFALGTDDRAAQGEGIADILALGCLGEGSGPCRRAPA
ncbi:hypothetical protein [Salipiger abyssi]|uniref:hypothetical protein n=1 Tax=Salipiger abyssi TaxID=1250539 RepID=UPI001F2B57F0|nr:hypothetical protein [Salipiger abyssi]